MDFVRSTLKTSSCPSRLFPNWALYRLKQSIGKAFYFFDDIPELLAGIEFETVWWKGHNMELSEVDPFELREAIEAKLRKIWKLQKASERKLAA